MISNVAVYLGSSSGKGEGYLQDAYAFGKALAERNIRLIYGGAQVGTMGALTRGVQESGGKVTGVFPECFRGKKLMIEKEVEVMAENLTEMIFTPDFPERIRTMEDLSEASVIFPGGIGTMNELFSYTVGLQLDFHHKPVIVYNRKGFYDPLRQQLLRMVEEGFMPESERDLVLFCDSVDQVVKCLEQL